MVSKKSSKKDSPSAGSLVVVEESRELRKAVEAIHVSSRQTLLQRKVFNNLVFYAYHDLLTKEVHQVDLSRLARDVGFDSKNIEFLKNAIRELIKTQVEFNILDKRGNIWNASSLLAEAAIGGGVVSYSISPTLRKALYNPKVFALINLNMQKRFNSGHAYSLYENAFRFKDVGSTGFISVDDWKSLFGIDRDKYPEFKYFNKEVLKPSVDEVNNVTDIYVEPELKKIGKKVVEIKMTVRMKTPEEIHGTSDDSSNFETNDESKKVLLLRRMFDLGITEKTAYAYLSKYPLDYIEGNLSEVELRILSGKVSINNIGAYFKSALEMDYRPKEPAIVKRARAEKDAVDNKAAEERERQEEANRKQKQRIADARRYFDALDANKKAVIENEFAVYLEKGNAFVFKSYRTSGLGSVMVRNTFDEWVADRKMDSAEA